jgi:hypothetical protein
VSAYLTGVAVDRAAISHDALVLNWFCRRENSVVEEGFLLAVGGALSVAQVVIRAAEKRGRELWFSRG